MAEQLSVNVVAKTLGIKSLVDLKAGFDMVKGAISAVSGIVKDVTAAYVEQEKVEAQLNAVLKSTGGAAGVTANELKNMASQLQDTTKFGDEAIIGGQNLLLTFTKIGKDVFPAATETMLNMSEALGQDMKSSAIQLGKALNDPVQGISALSRVGVQLSEEQQQLIKDFSAVGDIASAQKVILGELETQFGGAAKAAGDTFGGQLAMLQNTVGDSQEILGSYVALIGKDVVGSLNEGAKSINTFLKSAENMSKVATVASVLGGSFSVIKDIVVELSKGVGTFAKDILKTLSDNFEKLVGKGNEANTVFNILGGVVESLNTAFTISAKLINLVITAYTDLIKAISMGVGTVGDFFQALTGKKKWSEVVDNAKSTGEAFETFFSNITDNAIDTVKTTINEFKQLPKAATQTGDNLQKSYEETYSKINDVVRNAIAEQTALVQEGLDEKNSLLEEDNEKQVELLEAAKENGFEYYESIQGKALETFGVIGGAVDELMQRQIDANDKALQKQLASIDKHTKKVLKQHGLQEKSRSDQLKDEIAMLKSTIARTDDMEKQAAARDEIRTKTLEMKKFNILEDAEKQKEQANKKFAKKEHELRVRQFNANKAMQIAQVWINAGIGVVSAWASAAQWPGPSMIAGMALAGVMTGLILASAGVQTGLIASQQAPSFATGGMMSEAGVAMVGERGPELVELPAGARVRNAGETESILTRQQGETTNIIIENLVVQADDPNMLVEQLKEIRRFEGGR
jgi:hypothetical protein